MPDLMTGTPEEAQLAAAIFSLDDVHEAAHQWLEDMLEQLEEQGRLSATAQVVLTPEGQEDGVGTAVGMMLTVAFVPMYGGQPVVEPVLPRKSGVVH